MRFESFSGMHAVALLGVGAAIALFVRAGYAWRGSHAARQLEVSVAAAIVLLRTGVFIWNLLPERLSLARSLPLQICDLAALCAAWALVSDRGGRGPAAIAYFWGLALSIQGLVQPDLREGPSSLAFWLFWLHHALIVGAAVYLVTVRAYRPSRRDLLMAVGAGVVYAAVVFVVDVALDVNYGYLGRRTPSQPTLVDLLGPWPLRSLVMVALGAAVMALLYLPWGVRGPKRRIAAR